MKNFMILSILMLVLTACGNAEEAESEENQEAVQPIEAVVTMPEEMDTGDQVLETEVTQAGEAVSDADEVVFEVWQHGDKENSEMIEQESEENGVYSAEHSFEEDGIYLVQPHVTAREMHTMPVHTVIVGDVDQDEIDAFDESDIEEGSSFMDENDHNHEHDGDHDEEHNDDHQHGHSSDLDMSMTLDNDADPSVITVELNMDEEAYEADRVRLEVVDESDEEDIQWVDAEVQETGVYTAELDDIEEGTYNVILHVNGPDDLHEHTEEVFEVN